MKKYEVGFVAGASDVIHPGYIKLFMDAKEHCEKLIVLIHVDPSAERPHKLAPILSVEERAIILLELRSVDQIGAYHTEEDFKQWMHLHPEYVRFLGDDYIDANYTGKDLPNPIVVVDRSHKWSTTTYKKAIHHQVEVKIINEMLQRSAETKSTQ
jgi:cytidyltransferase-like protein